MPRSKPLEPVRPVGIDLQYLTAFHRPSGTVVHLHMPYYTVGVKGRSIADVASMCGQASAGRHRNGLAEPVQIAPVLPDPLPWCPTCVGLLAWETGRLGAVVAACLDGVPT